MEAAALLVPQLHHVEVLAHIPVVITPVRWRGIQVICCVQLITQIVTARVLTSAMMEILRLFILIISAHQLCDIMRYTITQLQLTK